MKKLLTTLMIVVTVSVISPVTLADESVDTWWDCRTKVNVLNAQLAMAEAFVAASAIAASDHAEEMLGETAEKLHKKQKECSTRLPKLGSRIEEGSFNAIDNDGKKVDNNDRRNIAGGDEGSFRDELSLHGVERNIKRVD